MPDKVIPPAPPRHNLACLVGLGGLIAVWYGYAQYQPWFVGIGLTVTACIVLHLGFGLKQAIGVTIVFSILAFLVLPAVFGVCDAQNRMARSSNLRAAAIAFHNYHEEHHHLPRAAILDPQGKPLLSWRVMLLPYLGHESLYRQFKLDEPWNSDHNLKLIPKIPTIFQPLESNSPHGYTHIVVLRGKGSIFDTDPPPTLDQVKAADGLTSTVLLIESGRFIPWTQPEDETVDPALPAPWFYRGMHRSGGYSKLAMLDGSVHSFYRSYEMFTIIDSQKLHALVTWKGNDLPASFDLDEDLFKKP